MKPVLTPAEMAAADQRAIAAGTPEAVLVERAGRAVARHALAMLGGSYGRRVVVVCGKGNNGADGRVAARVLRLRGLGVDELSLESGFDVAEVRRALGRADLLIDAMYGTGFHGHLGGPAEMLVDELAPANVRVLAIDIPSGVDGSTGEVAGVAVRAHETICFAAYKPGLLFEPGREHAGRIRVVDIGIAVEADQPQLAVLEVGDLSLPNPGADTHKWSSGCLVVGGSGGMVGAPMLASQAALHCGAGMVVCAVPGVAAAATVSGQELVARALTATPLGAFAEDAADEVLKEVGRYRALVVGPGFGRERSAQSAARRIVAEANVPIVIDADALNAIAVEPAALRVRHAAGLPVAVLTPHDGEYERLAGKPVGADRVAAARELAQQLHAVVLLKGPSTVIAAPDGNAVINVTGTPALATAGTGDVLSGVIGALLAQGVDPVAAAATGAYVHGRAARAAPSSPDIVASDLVPALPRTLQVLRTGRDPWEQ
ncbi:MAG: ADP-dependent NAD(P)H-hydrate dehydratase / NAD(P)H-hydrate epimerase [Actinomycetota bacterium]|nr:ADP-dependent NAD(P)H-hydrate dehydratase / NAD(P)H-hydrate epimerase [Actinomycetota bacterium]